MIEVYKYHTHNVCVAWETPAHRFHFWLDLETKEVERDTLYRRDATGDKVRTLRADAAVNKTMIDKVLARVERENLIQKAIDTFEAEQAAERENYRQQLLKRAEERLAIEFWDKALASIDTVLYAAIAARRVELQRELGL